MPFHLQKQLAFTIGARLSSAESAEFHDPRRQHTGGCPRGHKRRTRHRGRTWACRGGRAAGRPGSRRRGRPSRSSMRAACVVERLARRFDQTAGRDVSAVPVLPTVERCMPRKISLAVPRETTPSMPAANSRKDIRVEAEALFLPSGGLPMFDARRRRRPRRERGGIRVGHLKRAWRLMLPLADAQERVPRCGLHCCRARTAKGGEHAARVVDSTQSSPLEYVAEAIGAPSQFIVLLDAEAAAQCIEVNVAGLGDRVFELQRAVGPLAVVGFDVNGAAETFRAVGKEIAVARNGGFRRDDAFGGVRRWRAAV